MTRIIKRFGIITLLIAILLVAFSGSILAAGGNPDKGHHEAECHYGECICGDCEPKAHAYNWSYEFKSPGGHYGPYQHKYGNTTE